MLQWHQVKTCRVVCHHTTICKVHYCFCLHAAYDLENICIATSFCNCKRFKISLTRVYFDSRLFYVVNPCFNQFSCPITLAHTCVRHLKVPPFYFFFTDYTSTCFPGEGGKFASQYPNWVDVLSFSSVMLLFLHLPIFNLIQSTSDSREWGVRKYPHTTQILFLSSSLRLRNVRGVVAWVVASVWGSTCVNNLALLIRWETANSRGPKLWQIFWRTTSDIKTLT